MTTGYTNCSCLDCFDNSMDGTMCWACVEAGCDGGECQAPGAYGGESESVYDGATPTPWLGRVLSAEQDAALQREQADLQVPDETATGFVVGDYVTYVPRCDVHRVYLDRGGYATSRGQVGGEAGRYFGHLTTGPSWDAHDSHVWAVDCRLTGERSFIRAIDLKQAKATALATQPRHEARVTHARTRTVTIRFADSGELLVVMKTSCEPSTCRAYISVEARNSSR